VRIILSFALAVDVFLGCNVLRIHSIPDHVRAKLMRVDPDKSARTETAEPPLCNPKPDRFLGHAEIYGSFLDG
jgi:hypothetical protein